MRLLVTGGCGFIGSNFIQYILNKYPDYVVTTVDKLTYAGSPVNLGKWLGDPRCVLKKFDINSLKMEKEVMFSDIVVHFAAESHVDNSIKSADEFIKTNISGTYNIIKYAARFKKRFHHISTDEVFGSLDLDSSDKFNEETSYQPRNPYSASKAASDHFVRAFYETHGLRMTVSNCSNNYGPYQNIEKFIPKAIVKILNGEKVPVYGDGKNVRDWLYVEDHCRAIDLILHEGKIGETYCVGGMSGDISNLKILEIIAKIMGYQLNHVVKYVPDRLGHDRKYAIDWSKINKELGWKPKFELEENLKKTIDWYTKNKKWYKDQII
jgi:dTDP-glucose 4,6-dehydratase